MRTEEIKIYKFDELEDDAKEKARDWYRSTMESDDFDNLTEDFEKVAEILGIEFSARSRGKGPSKPCIWWSGFSSQGDGASFEGGYSYAPEATKQIREYAPQDETLHTIADELEAIQQAYHCEVSATISRGPGSNFYSHSGTMAVSVDLGETDYEAEKTPEEVKESEKAESNLVDCMRNFADWMYSVLEKENDYQNSDEVIDENIRANEYEFEEDGSRY